MKSPTACTCGYLVELAAIARHLGVTGDGVLGLAAQYGLAVELDWAGHNAMREPDARELVARHHRDQAETYATAAAYRDHVQQLRRRQKAERDAAEAAERQRYEDAERAGTQRQREREAREAAEAARQAQADSGVPSYEEFARQHARTGGK